MKRFLYIIIFIAASVLQGSAQVEENKSQAGEKEAQVEELETDSAVVKLRKDLLEIGEERLLEIQPSSPDFSLENPEISAMGLDAKMFASPSLNLERTSLPPIRWDGLPMNWQPTLPHWSTGYVTGYNGMVANPLSGGTNYAGAAIVQSLGRYWAMSLGTDVSKTFHNNFVYNQATLNGTLQYRPNQNFGVTIFGVYSPGTFLTNTPQIGAAWQYGGYVTLESDNHWGIDLGATQSYDRFSGHNATPIVKPYYNLGGAKLGIDFGPMIRDVLMNAFGKGHHGGGPIEFSPTGPRPMKNLPAVAPRR